MPKPMSGLAYAVCISSMLASAGAISADDATAVKEEAAGPNSPARPSIDAIDAALQTFVDERKIAGAVTLVGHQGKIVHLSAVGLANIESEQPMRPFSLFSIASMTKPITATAVMILQDDGKLSVDDKVSKYIPAFAGVELKDGRPPSREITIRDCLTHTAGLDGSQIFSGSLQDAVDELAGRKLAFQPGTQWKYSPGLNVAGRIVEIVSRQPLQDFIQQRIFAPLEMGNTTFFPEKKQRGRIATIYKPGEDERSLAPAENHIADPQSVHAPNPSGGLVSSARDLFPLLPNGSKQRPISQAANRLARSGRADDVPANG